MVQPYCGLVVDLSTSDDGDNPIISCQEKNESFAKLAGYSCHLILDRLAPPAIGLLLAFGEFLAVANSLPNRYQYPVYPAKGDHL
jgi:hypothetical protein